LYFLYLYFPNQKSKYVHLTQLAKKEKTFGLENRSQIRQIIIDDIFVPFYCRKQNPDRYEKQAIVLKSLNFRYQKGVFTGSMGDIFETMRKLMNFTFSALPSTDGFYGAKVGLAFNGTVSQDFELMEVFKSFSSPALQMKGR
jgi:hypothetical protein